MPTDLQSTGPTPCEIEDLVIAWIDAASDEAQATMLYALNRRGWTFDRAQRVRDAMNRRTS